MTNLLYRKFINPRSHGKDAQRREYILNILLCGSLAIGSIALVATVITYITPPYNTDVASGLFTGIFWLLLLALLFLSRRGYWRFGALIFVILIVANGVLFCVTWGFGLAVAELLFGLSIVVSGVLFSASISISISSVVAGLVLGLAYMQTNGIIIPKSSWRKSPDNFDDAIAYAVIFILIGIISWLWNRETDASLRRARSSEAELQKERDNLEITVAQRTHELKELQASRLLEMQPLAELGRIGASLIHDMSSPLTAASMQLEMIGKTKQSQSLKAVSQNIEILGKYLVAARHQLQHTSEETYFDVAAELQQVVGLLKHRARTLEVALHIGRLPKHNLYGDAVKFHKIVANLIANALDASESAARKDVYVKIVQKDDWLELSVHDFGIGIPESLMPHLFEPFYSTKKLSDTRGLGIGLAMVKQFVVHDFGGRIEVSSHPSKGTIFTVKFPQRRIKI